MFLNYQQIMHTFLLMTTGMLFINMYKYSSGPQGYMKIVISKKKVLLCESGHYPIGKNNSDHQEYKRLA